jgi:prepilin-type N-terminal cleavage/methylation domain-containing protein
MQEPRQLHDRLSTRAAFSLLELLVVVAVLLVLTTMYWNHGPSKRDRELAACRHNLEKIYLALQIYAHDNSGEFPVVTNALTAEDALAPLVPHYTSDTSVFVCPASGDSPLPIGKAFRDWKISYAYYMGCHETDAGRALMSDEQVNTFSKDTGATVFSETGKAPGNNHGKGGGNFLICDGSVISSAGTAPISLILTPPVVLLNPKP